jgi:acyl-CoA thioester hydrolase
MSALVDGTFDHEIRVIFGDTDQMGIVYYANYLRFFESARSGYWRALGRSYKDLEALGVAMPVVEAHCDYKRPSYYEDLLVIETRVSELRAASLRFWYRVRRDGVLLAEGYTRHAIIDGKGKPLRIPEHIRMMIPPITT